MSTIGNGHRQFSADALERTKAPFMIFLGSRHSGKSCAIKQIYLDVLKRWRFDHHVVFSRTLRASDFYPEFIPGKNQYTRFSPAALQALWDKMENAYAMGKAKKALVIFDDCIGYDTKYDKTLLDLATMGRHLGITTIFATQSSTMVHYDWKENATQVFCFPSTDDILEKFADKFVRRWVDKDVGVSRKSSYWLDKACRVVTDIWKSGEYTACVVDLHNNTPGMDEKQAIQWYNSRAGPTAEEETPPKRGRYEDSGTESETEEEYDSETDSDSVRSYFE